MLEEEIAQLKQAIQDLGYAWQAGVTALSHLPVEERQARLGLRPEFAVMQGVRPLLSVSAPAPAFPPAWDWRNVQGADWTTPVGDQGKCTACVAFSTVAVMDTMLKRLMGDAGLAADLSEGHLFFAGCGACCSSGWWPTEALEYARIRGVPDEACLPYRESGPDGAARTDWQNRAVKVTGWREVADLAARKAWLATKGPMMACLGVYDDLFHYTGGVYRHTQGTLLGYHAVCAAGYSEAEQAWICKNSWGTDWGEAGWVRIGYGEAGIDTQFAMYGIEGVAPSAQPQPAPRTLPSPAPLPSPVPLPVAGSGCNLATRLMGRLRGEPSQ